ncbi:MAG: recombinase family protein [Pseudomonadota bacterium]
MRAALYARFSTDGQNPRSIADQLVDGRRHADRLGASVDGEFSDAALSAVAMANRPGLQALLEAVRARRFDVVIAEDLSRLTRDGGHPWDLFYEFEDLGVKINTLAEGEVNELVIGLKGTSNAVERKATGARVRRGLAGVVRSGRAASKPPYGYRARLAYDAGGERIRGLRDIDPLTAPIVRRIHAEYLAGSSAQAIATRLNAEGVPGPAGGLWHANALLGDRRREQGILRNPIYAGVVAWNRATHPKSRGTGRARARPNLEAEILRQPVPELRIVDAETWSGVQARLQAQASAVAAAGNPSAANAPRRLFSGLLHCGVCGGSLRVGGPDRRYRCRTRMDKGASACSNSRTAPADKLEAEILDQLRRDLLHPDLVEAMVKEYRTLQARKASGDRARRAGLERDLAEAGRRADRLVDQVADGALSGRAVKAKLAELEARQAKLSAELAAIAAGGDVVALHPHAAARYRAMVEDLQAKLEGDQLAERDAARTALRLVIRNVLYHPGERRGEWRLEIDGDLSSLFRKAAQDAPQTRRARGT